MDYDYEPLLDPSNNYQWALQEYQALTLNLKERLIATFDNLLDVSNEELSLIDGFEVLIYNKQEDLFNTFNEEYLKLIKEEKYFFGCPFGIYKNTYKERLDSFLNEFPDGNEKDFINYELEKGILTTEYDTSQEILQKLFFSLQKRLEFLMGRANLLGYDITINIDEEKSSFRIIEKKFSESLPVVDKSQIQWVGGQTQFMELIKALIENGNLKGKSQKEIVSSFASFLNIDINYPDKIIQDIRNRNIGSETLFLNQLKSTLYNFIVKEKKR